MCSQLRDVVEIFAVTTGHARNILLLFTTSDVSTSVPALLCSNSCPVFIVPESSTRWTFSGIITVVVCMFWAFYIWIWDMSCPGQQGDSCRVWAISWHPGHWWFRNYCVLSLRLWSLVIKKRVWVLIERCKVWSCSIICLFPLVPWCKVDWQIGVLIIVLIQWLSCSIYYVWCSTWYSKKYTGLPVTDAMLPAVSVQ